MIKTKKQMFIVIGAFALVMLLGEITYAFFNYTRTGTANVIRTGQINFTTTQTSGQNGAISLTNVFPVDVSEGIPANDPNVGEVTINITGDTEYTGGIEYLVTATNVTNTVGSKTIPIGVNVTATSGLGTSDDDYFTDKENNPETSIYKVLAGDTISNNDQLLVGYIKSGQTGVNGNVVIKAYIDASKVAISDTYYENATATPTPTAPTDEYGTPASFGEGRVVLTTTEWNSLRTNGVSFQVKVEAKEDIWVEDPTVPLAADLIGSIQTLATTPYGKVYSGDNVNNYVTFNGETWRILGVYGDSIKIIRAGYIVKGQDFNESSNNGNAWADSSIKEYLYTTYYPTLSSTARQMINENATWNVGECSKNLDAGDSYTCATATTWQGKIGLLTSYDYLYSAATSCWNTEGYDYDGGCGQGSWLFYGALFTTLPPDHSWTMTPSDENSSKALSISIDFGYVGISQDSVSGTTPVLMLKPGVTITGGTGASGDAYTLGYTAS